MNVMHVMDRVCVVSVVKMNVWQICAVCFVLETIRTGAMRVVHITVNTEETQILRIEFVLVLSYLNQTHLSIVCTVVSYLCLPTQASLPFQLSNWSKILATTFCSQVNDPDTLSI